MAKRKKRAQAGRAPRVESLAAVASTANIRVIEVPANGMLKVVVDVGPMSIPYAIHYAGRTVFTALVDRAVDVMPLEAGDRVLGWSFSHTEKDWLHTIGVIVNSGPVQLLESKSEAKKDADHSVGFVIVRS